VVLFCKSLIQDLARRINQYLCKVLLDQVLENAGNLSPECLYPHHISYSTTHAPNSLLVNKTAMVNHIHKHGTAPFHLLWDICKGRIRGRENYYEITINLLNAICNVSSGELVAKLHHLIHFKIQHIDSSPIHDEDTVTSPSAVTALCSHRLSIWV
jgi:hypothetical protein